MNESSSQDICPHCGRSIRRYSPKPYHLKPNDVFAKRYVVGGVLDEDAISISYIGIDAKVNEKVVIKEYYPVDRARRNGMIVIATNESLYEQGKQQFIQDAGVVKTLNLSILPKVREVALDNNTAYVIEDYVKGQSFKEMASKRSFFTQELIDIMQPIFVGLPKLHEGGMVHRNISPSSLILNNGEIMIKDVGYGKTMLEGEKSISFIKSLNSGFSPIEQYNGEETGAWTDVYGLCASIYSLITGKMLPSATERDIQDTLQKPSSLNITISSSQEKALMKGLEVSPKKRYKTISSLYNGLLAKPANLKLFLPIGILLAGIVLVASVLLNAFGDRGSSLDDGYTVPSTPVIQETVNQNDPDDDSSLAPIVFGDWKDNYLMANPINISTYSRELENEMSTVFDSSYKRSDISNVVFMSDKMTAPENAWDVSEKKDKSVLAYVMLTNPDRKLYTLYICADGGINAKNACADLFAGYVNLESIDFNKSFHTDEVKSMAGMFAMCESLKSIDLSDFVTSRVRSMYSMFYDCKSLNQLNLSMLDTGNVRDLGHIFHGCESLADININGWETTYVTNVNSMFSNCEKLTRVDIKDLETPNVTDFSYMFFDCGKLEEVDVGNFDTSEATTMKSMFYGCENLLNVDVSKFDTTYVSDFSRMFYSCNNLEEIDVSNFSTSEGTDFKAMFYACEKLKMIDTRAFNTKKATDVSYMFDECNSLDHLDASAFDLKKISKTTNFTSNNTSFIDYKPIDGSSGTKGMGHDNLFDRNLKTKWSLTIESNLAYVEWEMTEPVIAKRLYLTTGENCTVYEGRNPRDFTLYGASKEDKDNDNWTIIKQVKNTKMTDENNVRYAWDLDDNEDKYQSYRIEVTTTTGSTVLQLSEASIAFE